MEVRPAERGDLESLRAIRNHYAAHSHARFEEEPESLETTEAWLGGYAADGPHRLLVAEAAGEIVGYASSQPYRTHPAFRKTVETSLYVAPGKGGGGVGSALYAVLLDALADEGLHRAVAAIALPNEASVRLHERCGFTKVGVFSEYAVKNGRFYSSLWMERPL